VSAFAAAFAVIACGCFAAQADAFVYRSDQGGSIGRANLEGSGVNNTFITATKTGANLLSGIAVDGQHIYRDDFGDHSIGRANLDGTDVNDSVITTGVGSGPVGTGATPTGFAATPALAGSIAWRPCGKQLQCARVRVPLDWSRPAGPKISLAVIRRPAADPARRIGSLFVNPGGPGGSVQQVRRDGAQLERSVNGRFDIVGWDIRGAGASTHIRCFHSQRAADRFFAGWSVPTTLRASPTALRRMAALARRCAALSGSLLAHISTEDTARDLNDLRRLVGDRRLTYEGISAGTFIGQTYANMFPGRVRAMTLDGVVDPIAYTRGTIAGYANQLSYADHAFAGFESLCRQAGPARCALAGHGPVTAGVSRLWARLRHGSIPAPDAKPTGRLSYGDALQAVLLYMSGGPGTWPTMANNLAAAERGDGSGLLTASRVFTAAFTEQSAAPGLPAIGLTCADSPAAQGQRAWRQAVGRLTRVSSLYGPVLAWWRWAPCAAWPVRSADRYTGPWNATTPHPILVIGTRHDPNTPYANAVRTAGRLGNAVLLTLNGYSHTSPQDPSACIQQAETAYLVHLNTPPRGTVCQPNHPPFDPDFGRTPSLPSQ
jgi:pimeloyl-ACP methyl ester carboxylesterase